MGNWMSFGNFITAKYYYSNITILQNITVIHTSEL